MKKEKLLVKEINVLSEVISKKVNEERKKMLDEKLEKDKDYKLLLEKVKEFNVEIEKLRKVEKEFDKSIEKIVSKLDLGFEKNKLGYLNCNRVMYFSKEYGVNRILNNVYESDVYNRLMIENIDGDLNVSNLIDRMVKEFVSN
jgi:hypothetical protein